MDTLQCEGTRATCVEGNACGAFAPESFSCVALEGESDVWACSADVPVELKLGFTNLVCRGDECDVEYALWWRTQGERASSMPSGALHVCFLVFSAVVLVFMLSRPRREPHVRPRSESTMPATYHRPEPRTEVKQPERTIQTSSTYRATGFGSRRVSES